MRLRVGRGLTTVVDTLGLDADRRSGWIAQARAHGLATACVVFETPTTECRARNRARNKIVPERVLAQQARQVKAQRDALDRRVRCRPRADGRPPRARAHRALALRSRPRRRPHPWVCDSGSRSPRSPGPAARPNSRGRLRAIASAAEDAGFDSIWVMDHFRQIPMFGPAWHDMLESYTTLAYLAAATERMRLGTLVTGVTYRNVGHLGKIIATLDVLSGGRAMCGLGLGWFRAEHDAYGMGVPVRRRRATRCLEDALQVLPMLWGKGAPAFEGRVLRRARHHLLPPAAAGTRPDARGRQR